MIKYFTNQNLFFSKIYSEKYIEFENNLCWLINIFIILKDIWFNLSEKEIFEKSLEIKAYDSKYWWKYLWLIKILNNYWVKAKILNIRFFHIFFLNKVLKNIEKNNIIFIPSIKSWEEENHLIIIEDFKSNVLCYKSVWTKNSLHIENWKINLNNFLKIYNKRWIIVYNKA